MASNTAKIILTAEDKTRAAFASVSKAFDGIKRSAFSLQGVIGGALGGLGARQIANMADEYSNLQARLKLASRDAFEFAAANDAIRRIASAAQTPLSETATLYTRIASSLKDAGVSQTDMVSTTESVALALRISGASAAEASSAMLQFSQAIASGVLRGEEFNAVNESAPRLMQALAKSLGVGVGALRDMAKEGQLTRDVLINALARELPTLRREAESLPKTIGAAFTDLGNKLLDAVGGIDQVTGASAKAAEYIKSLGDGLVEYVRSVRNAISTFGGVGKGLIGEIASGQINPFTTLREDLKDVQARIKAIESGKGILGGAGVYSLDFLKKQEKYLKNEISISLGLPTKDEMAAEAKRQVDATRRALEEYRKGGSKAGPAAELTKGEPKRIGAEQARQFEEAMALEDYRIEQETKTKLEAYRATQEFLARQQDDVNELNKAMADESARAAEEYARRLESLVSDTTLAKTEQLQSDLDFINQAFFDGKIGAQQYDEAVAKLTDGTSKLGQEVKKTKTFAEEFGLVFESAFENAIVGGKKFSDVLKALEQDIARIIIRKSVTEPLGNAVSGLLGKIDFGSIFGKLFGGGRAGGGPVDPGKFYVVGERGPELLLPRSRGMVMPAGGGAGGVNIVQNITVDSRSDRASIITAMTQAKELAKAEIMASMQRGGSFAMASGRT